MSRVNGNNGTINFGRTPRTGVRLWDFAAERAQKMTFTPEDARWVLENCNAKNRPLSKPARLDVATALLEGRWVVNGETIVFGRGGDLHDGQHRLEGCVLADLPLETWVVFGVAPESFDTLDQGRVRTSSDVLAIEGKTCVSTYAAAAALLHLDEADQLGDMLFRRVPRHLVVATAKDHPGLEDSARFSSASAAKRFASKRLLAFAHYRFTEKDPAMAARFFDDLGSGAGLPARDPVLMLRNRLMLNAASKAKLDHLEILALVIKAWNCRREGRTAGVLKWNSQAGEAFPAIL